MSNKLRKIILGLLAGAGFAFCLIGIVNAQMGGGISTPSLWKKITGGIHPIVTTDTIGTSADRVAGVYSDLIDGTSLVIGGAVAGNLSVNGTITAPVVVATSTLADSSFQRLTWVQATGTHTTSTNLFVTNSQATNFTATNATATYFAVTNVNSDLIPLANNTYDIGAFGLAWKNIYTSGTSYVSGIESGGIIMPSLNNTYDLGAVTSSWKNLYVSSTSFLAGVSSTGGIYPTITNNYDLGASELAWKNIYASGTLTIGGSLGAAGNALSPATANFLNIGSETARWNRLHVADIYLGGLATFGAASLTGASTTRSIASSYIGFGDQSFTNREYLFTGATYGSAAQSLSLIESTTGTLKVTNGSTNGGFGNLSVGAVTSSGPVSPAANNLYDLGAYGTAWKNIYSSGTSYLTNIYASSGSTGAPSYSFDLNSDTGMYMRGTTKIGFSIDGDELLVIDADATELISDMTLLPSQTNNVDIGSPAKSWSNFYASGTAVIGTGGSAGKAMCWKADGKTLGYCSSAPDAGGSCTCN